MGQFWLKVTLMEGMVPRYEQDTKSTDDEQQAMELYRRLDDLLAEWGWT